MDPRSKSRPRAATLLVMACFSGFSYAAFGFSEPPGAQGAQEASTARRSVWDGVYTDEQAKRGEAQYARNCESCHGADLSGNQVNEIPALAWDAFLTQWGDRTVRDLYETVNRSMPKDNPKSLNARAYIDVIAYLLQSNKFPSGSRDLSLNPAALGEIVIERTKK
jgi:mono/diheme cytochrome c family protein